MENVDTLAICTNCSTNCNNDKELTEPQVHESYNDSFFYQRKNNAPAE